MRILNDKKNKLWRCGKVVCCAPVPWLKHRSIILIVILTTFALLWTIPSPAAAANEAAAVTNPATRATPLAITIEDAILLALENNRSLRIERLAPAITRTLEEQAQSVFDPVVGGEGTIAQEKSPTSLSAPEYAADTTSGTSHVSLDAGQYFATGTRVGIEASYHQFWSDRYSDRYQSRVGFNVTQALLEGRGLDVNRATLRQARLDTRITQYELRGFAENLLDTVEETYWDYALALRQIKIYEESLQLAEQQLAETREMIRVGSMAETELIASQAEIALRHQELILARATMETTRLKLLRLLNPPGSNLWEKDIILLTQPAEPVITVDDVKAHVAVALQKRPELHQARLNQQRGELEVVKTKNGLLPKLDLFITLGKTGYAESFGNSVDDISGEGYDALAGLTFSYPIKNREARARHQRSQLNLEQAKQSLENLSLLVELDVRSAYIEMNRSKEQIGASRATRQLEEEKLRIETERFRVGRSTNFLVAQAQRDLVRSQIAEIQAVANYLKALIRLHRLEGSLLDRRGIIIPEAN
jgi:outer membrane protein TolC